MRRSRVSPPVAEDSFEAVVRALRGVPSRRIGEVSSGDLVIVRGTVAAAAGRPRVRSPLTAEPCLLWSLRVTDPQSDHGATELERQRGAALVVTDGTGRAHVDGRDALFVTERRVRMDAEEAPPRLRALLRAAGLEWDPHLACEVAELRVGDTVAVRGVTRIESDSVEAETGSYRDVGRTVAIGAAPDRRVIVALGPPYDLDPDVW